MLEETHSLEILKEITKISTSELDLDNILNQIITVVKNKMHIDACGIYLTDEDGSHLHMEASDGLRRSNKVSLEMGRGITGWVAQNKVTLALSEALHDPRFVYFPEIEEEKFKSMLSVPILTNDKCIGVINVQTFEQRDFSEMECSLLETIADQISGCIHNAVLFTKRQMLLKELTILYDVSLAVQATLKLEDRLWIVLSGLTHGAAGGFNRTILFLLNEKTKVFQGIMGLGPDSPEDAQRIWTALSQKRETLSQSLFTEAETEQYNKSAFNAFAKTLRFPFRPGENIFSESALQKKTINIVDGYNHPLVPKDFLYTFGINTFAITPLIARDEILGLIMVDNRYNYKPITEDNIRLLTRFAVHASWIIENSRLFAKLLDTNRELLSIKEQLIESEKLSALGELSAEVAHEIKNPLVSIGGFARRLKDKISKIRATEEYISEMESASNYANIIVDEVERMENMLKNILIYSKAGNLELTECDLRDLLNDVLNLFQSGLFNQKIIFHCNFSDTVERVYIDYAKMKQVLINLFYNAVESMPEGGEITLGVYSQDNQVATISICDTGGGIPPEVYANIFNPFFTTKGTGTGLGLSICRKIVEIHNGKILVENNVGKGVTVYIHLPIQKVCDYTTE